MDTAYSMTPRDLLFMRDARPMEAADVGCGANLPRANQLHAALLNHLHNTWPTYQPWEGSQNTGKESRNAGIRSNRFSATKTFGPFPMRDGKLYFPIPLDWDQRLVPCTCSNLPAPLTHAFIDNTVGKKAYPRLISEDIFLQYLHGETPAFSANQEPIFFAERNVGIGIDPEKGTTRKGQFYQSEYLRLAEDVSFFFTASCKLKNGNDAFEKLGGHFEFPFGGQQGVVYVEHCNRNEFLPLPKITSRYLRWTLLSPTLFVHGWIPDWCVDSRRNLPESDKASLGTVMLPGCSSAKLIAARIGEPDYFSGWELQVGPRPTQAAVPAGSCYIFDCGTTENAAQLATMLNPPNRRGSLLTTCGFGVGICSSIHLSL